MNFEIFCTSNNWFLIKNIHKLLAGTLYLSEKIIPILNSYAIYQNHLIEEENKINDYKNYRFMSDVQFQVPSFVLGNDLIM